MSELLNGTDFTKIIVQIISAVDMVNIAILWQKLIFSGTTGSIYLKCHFPMSPPVRLLDGWSFGLK